MLNNNHGHLLWNINQLGFQKKFKNIWKTWKNLAQLMIYLFQMIYKIKLISLKTIKINWFSLNLISKISLFMLTERIEFKLFRTILPMNKLMLLQMLQIIN